MFLSTIIQPELNFFILQCYDANLIMFSYATTYSNIIFNTYIIIKIITYIYPIKYYYNNIYLSLNNSHELVYLIKKCA